MEKSTSLLIFLVLVRVGGLMLPAAHLIEGTVRFWRDFFKACRPMPNMPVTLAEEGASSPRHRRSTRSSPCHPTYSEAAVPG